MKKISLLELRSFVALEIRRLAYFGYLQIKIMYYSEIERKPGSKRRHSCRYSRYIAFKDL